MQDSVKSRLERAIELSGSNYKEFALKCGIPYRTLQSYLSGEREPGAINLTRIATIVHISIDWLLTGQGDMIRGVTPALNETGIVPVYAMAGAGTPKDLTDYDPIDHIRLPEGFIAKGIVPIKIKGHSMEPTIWDGAFVGINRTIREVISGEIYAVSIPNEGAVVKRLFLQHDRVIVRSDNPSFPAFEVMNRELEHAHGDNFILGRLVWVIQRIKQDKD